MAIIHEFSEKERKEWEAWIETRPKSIQKMIKKFPPDILYRMKSTGHRVALYSYEEDGTMTVLVTGKYNKLSLERRVFGIKAEDLVECDLPDEDEELGVVPTVPDGIKKFMNHILRTDITRH